MSALSTEKLLKYFDFVQRRFASLECLFLGLMSEVMYDVEEMQRTGSTQARDVVAARMCEHLLRLTDILEQHKLTMTTELLISTRVLAAPKPPTGPVFGMAVPMHAMQANAPNALLAQLKAALRTSAGNTPLPTPKSHSSFSPPPAVPRPGTVGSSGIPTPARPAADASRTAHGGNVAGGPAAPTPRVAPHGAPTAAASGAHGMAQRPPGLTVPGGAPTGHH